MSRDYTDYPERESRHIVKNERNDYQDKFFHDIDLDFLLDAIMNIELEGYTLNIVNNKLQLLDNDGDGVYSIELDDKKVYYLVNVKDFGDIKFCYSYDNEIFEEIRDIEVLKDVVNKMSREAAVFLK